jgi:hypothetical protein
MRLLDTSLRVANRRAGGIVRRVIGGLCDKPWEVPSRILARCTDEGHHHASIGARVDVMLRGLMGIGLSLVPEESAKAMNSKLVDARLHHCLYLEQDAGRRW